MAPRNRMPAHYTQTPVLQTLLRQTDTGVSHMPVNIGPGFCKRTEGCSTWRRPASLLLHPAIMGGRRLWVNNLNCSEDWDDRQEKWLPRLIWQKLRSRLVRLHTPIQYGIRTGVNPSRLVIFGSGERHRIYYIIASYFCRVVGWPLVRPLEFVWRLRKLVGTQSRWWGCSSRILGTIVNRPYGIHKNLYI